MDAAAAAAKAKPVHGPASIPKQEVPSGVGIPLMFTAAVVDTNQPAYLSLTNTTTALPPLAPDLTNLNPNPTNAPAAGSKQRDPADVKWLQDNPNPKRVATFEKKYGQGAAAAYLQTNTGSASICCHDLWRTQQ